MGHYFLQVLKSDYDEQKRRSKNREDTNKEVNVKFYD